jgi:membrane protein YqaA with SNARE-associated domain
MMRRLYDWIMELAASDRAPSALFWVSFIESSFFPIPPDVMLIPMAIANRAKAWWYATIATVGSVVGGLLGYVIGYLLFDLVGKPILNLYGYTDKFQEFAAQYNEYGAWIVFMAGLTPFPYKVITIASGTTSMNILLFVVASIAGRAGRFFAVAGLLYFFGQPIRTFIERYFGILTVLFFVLLLGGFAAVRFLF